MQRRLGVMHVAPFLFACRPSAPASVVSSGGVKSGVWCVLPWEEASAIRLDHVKFLECLPLSSPSFISRAFVKPSFINGFTVKPSFINGFTVKPSFIS